MHPSNSSDYATPIRHTIQKKYSDTSKKQFLLHRKYEEKDRTNGAHTPKIYNLNCVEKQSKKVRSKYLRKQ